MNIALSQAAAGRPPFGAARHPAGLMVVIGLHVIVAGVLLTARSMRTATAEPPVIDVLPQPLPATPVVRHVELPPHRPPTIYAEEPRFKVDPDQPVPAAPHGKPADPPPDVHADGGGEKLALAEPVRSPPRAGRLDANAAQCRPEYPAAAARTGATGVSHLRFTIAPSGRVMNAQILQPSGPTREHRLLDQAAAAALAQCPVTVGTDEAGHAVASTADVEYVWTLN